MNLYVLQSRALPNPAPTSLAKPKLDVPALRAATLREEAARASQIEEHQRQRANRSFRRQLLLYSLRFFIVPIVVPIVLSLLQSLLARRRRWGRFLYH
jgi:hypothetical protein